MTTHTSDAVDAGIMPDFSQAGVVLTRTTQFTTTDDSIVSGDTIQMIPVPNDAKILGIDMYYDALPACATGCEIGYGGDPDAFMANLPMTGTNFRSWPGTAYDNDTTAGFLYTFTADDTIDIAIHSASTKIPTDVNIYMAVRYTMTGTLSDET